MGELYTRNDSRTNNINHMIVCPHIRPINCPGKNICNLKVIYTFRVTLFNSYFVVKSTICVRFNQNIVL